MNDVLIKGEKVSIKNNNEIYLWMLPIAEHPQYIVAFANEFASPLPERRNRDSFDDVAGGDTGV